MGNQREPVEADDIPRTLSTPLHRIKKKLSRIFLRHADKIERALFWNIDDGDTWLRNWPVRGRPNHPLLFDGSQRPKPAFHAVVELARSPREAPPGATPPAAKDP